MKRIYRYDILLNPEDPGEFDKIFNCLQKDDLILTIIYDEKQYKEFKKWYFNVIGENSDSALGKYKNPKSNQKYAPEGTYIFPVCISIGDAGLLGHQGATATQSFKKILKRDDYMRNLEISLDVIINFKNYPEYQV